MRPVFDEGVGTTSGGGAKRSDLPTWASLGQETVSEQGRRGHDDKSHSPAACLAGNALQTYGTSPGNTGPHQTPRSPFASWTGQHERAPYDTGRHHRPRTSKPVCRRELAGGFDSRPPPLRDSGSDQHRCVGQAPNRPRRRGLPGLRKTGAHTRLRRDLTKSSLADPPSELDKSSRSRSESWTSLDVR